MYDPEVGYCQGSLFIAGILLMNVSHNCPFLKFTYVYILYYTSICVYIVFIAVMYFLLSFLLLLFAMSSLFFSRCQRRKLFVCLFI